MAFSQTDLDNIDKAIASGERVVEIDGVKTEYRSVGELIRARTAIRSQLNAAAATVPRPRAYRARSSKGL